MSTIHTNTSNDESQSVKDDLYHLDHDPEVFDVLIIGGGPCGLAAAARIREQAPSAMFTDEEHRRFHWLNKHGKRVALKQTKTGHVSPACCSKPHHYKIAVLDSSDNKWLSRWRRLFSTFDISHLRSPMLWHVDPLDRDSLLSHAHFQGRAGELVEIRGCVGKETSKHQKKKNRFSGGRKEDSVDINQRDQWDYYTPSQSLFCDHCDCVARRYELEAGLVHKEEVTDIRFGDIEDSHFQDKLFTVTTNQSVRLARSVILAVGPANAPVLPEIPSLSFPGHRAAQAVDKMPQACHSMAIPQNQFPDAIVQHRMQDGRQTNILVVGGGLTSAQLSDLAIRKGVGRVWHIMRGPLRTKAFDVDLHWMGKYKTLHQAYFHQADSDEERLDIIKEARGGGSITPAFMKRLKPHMSSGRLKMFEKTALIGADFELCSDGEGGAWRIKTEPMIVDLPRMDYIYFATGIQSDFTTLPYMQNMLREYPIRGVGGLPCLNEDLMWRDDVPLFVAGRLAALRLGPAAPNIGGARIGAERIALVLEEILGRADKDDGSRTPFLAEDEILARGRQNSELELFHYASGTGSKYNCLVEVSE
ncbi:hypothetical protein M406DRAFT_67391 [Cryphonectria parasitica EP155]|uniref:L-ornithine N(5)-oxygenase n=1 Tax=Cryphonectria parasitica (strain ATCC 38755 / EP155) TaxID=660469 RepID=A0A9P4YDJ5_CRYP1|nr:uncharacterized protein M406DRAFT_67391 [Cryphonectria parasitica EP155]KAF3771055.1 hypothetical protein M406DRAFT_67391 [Cryphonectria parasitica EP155]